jgi:hypothetical protein
MASSSLLSIRIAARNTSLRIERREGRFGEFFAICDDCGTIEVADTFADAEATILEAGQ